MKQTPTSARWTGALGIGIMLAATVAAAEPRPVTGVMVAGGGTITRYDGGRKTVLLECTRRWRVTADHTVKEFNDPCATDSIVTHPSSGRWAAVVDAWAVQAADLEDTLIINGTPIALPKSRAASLFLHAEGDLLVLGDARGVIAITQGNPAMWNDDGILRMQSPLSFADDGNTVFVVESTPTSKQLARYSFESTPHRTRVGAADADLRGVVMVSGSPTILRVGAGPLKTVALPAGSRRLGTLPLAGTDIEMPLLRGDNLYFYRAGHFRKYRVGRETVEECDDSAHGGFRRYNLKTKVETLLLADPDDCLTRIAPFLRSTDSATDTMFMVHNSSNRGKSLYRATGTGPAEPVGTGSFVQADQFTGDGRLVLVWTYADGLVVFDATTNKIAMKVPVSFDLAKGGHQSAFLADGDAPIVAR